LLSVWNPRYHKLIVCGSKNGQKKKNLREEQNLLVENPTQIMILGIIPPSIPYESSLLSLQTVVCRERMELLLTSILVV